MTYQKQQLRKDCENIALTYLKKLNCSTNFTAEKNSWIHKRRIREPRVKAYKIMEAAIEYGIQNGVLKKHGNRQFQILSKINRNKSMLETKKKLQPRKCRCYSKKSLSRKNPKNLTAIENCLKQNASTSIEDFQKIFEQQSASPRCVPTIDNDGMPVAEQQNDTQEQEVTKFEVQNLLSGNNSLDKLSLSSSSIDHQNGSVICEIHEPPAQQYNLRCRVRKIPSYKSMLGNTRWSKVRRPRRVESLDQIHGTPVENLMETGAPSMEQNSLETNSTGICCDMPFVQSIPDHINVADEQNKECVVNPV